MTLHLKETITTDSNASGIWLSVGHPAMGELAAISQFDFAVVDTEHTSMSLETVENLVRGIQMRSDTTGSIVRVPWNDPVRIKRVLDTGPDGVMIPMVGDAEDAAAAVEATRYPPAGVRGVAGSRATGYGADFVEYVTEQSEDVFVAVQIETEAGLEHCGEIATVDGVDALFVGPADLSLALDSFADWDSNALVGALDRVLDAGRTAGTPVGTLALSESDVTRYADMGFDFLILGKDTIVLRDAFADIQTVYEAASGGTDGDAN